MLVKDGRYRDVYIPEDMFQELREAVLERERLVEQLIILNNQVLRWLDIRFPEFNRVFKDWSRNAAWLTLKHYPTPRKVVAAGVLGIMATWRKEMKKPSLKKAERIVAAASESIGRIAGSEAAEASLQNLLTQYEMIDRQKQDTEELMQELLLRVPYAFKLMDIKGIGVVTAAVIVSEIGDIHRFRDPRQIQKMAGLNLRENSSGKHKGKTTISKRGRKRLREGLFKGIIAMLATNQEFRAIHWRNLTREKNPLTKMESIIALCGKLIRVIFAILTKGNDYDAKKMMDDMSRSTKVA